jgi:diphthamide synthase (EF-2-diphthine--ammonia ligase)
MLTAVGGALHNCSGHIQSNVIILHTHDNIDISAAAIAAAVTAAALLHCCRYLHQPQERHPDVQAVASGAIASDYQRLRVESVSVFSTRRTTCLGDSS